MTPIAMIHVTARMTKIISIQLTFFSTDISFLFPFGKVVGLEISVDDFPIDGDDFFIDVVDFFIVDLVGSSTCLVVLFDFVFGGGDGIGGNSEGSMKLSGSTHLFKKKEKRKMMLMFINSDTYDSCSFNISLLTIQKGSSQK